MTEETSRSAGPDARRVFGLADLARELGLLRARAARGTGRARVSLDELAQRAGLPRSTVHAHVTGQRLPPSDALDRIVIALRATPSEQRDWGEAWFRLSADQVDMPGNSPVPHQLPLAVGDFTGRAAELAELDRAAVIAVVSGTAGVGKTALALHWARTVASAFPDGQFYADLRGFDPDLPVEPGEVVAGFLRSLGVAGAEIPLETAERSAELRSLLEGRRCLLLLDNARDSEHVRPLLPGARTCRVVVTSRDRLAGLVARDGAHRIDLDVLPPDDATELLRRLVGRRVDDEPAAAGDIARRCAHLPLALRIAAELAVAQPDASLGDLAAGLNDEQRRLDLLVGGNDPRSTVRTVFAWSYRQLPAAAARLFRLLSQNPGSNIESHAAAALAGADLRETRRSLGVLVRTSLLNQIGPDRFAMHDLLRAWSAERVDIEEPPPERRAAQRRLYDYQLGAAATAMDVLYPHERDRRPVIASPASPGPSLADKAAARRWLDAERSNLLALAAAAQHYDQLRYAVQLSPVLWRYLRSGAHHDEALQLHGHALSAARTSDDRTGQARALNALGTVHEGLGRFQESDEYHRQALELFSELGDRSGQARALTNIGLANDQLGRYQQAAEHYRQAIAVHRELGDDNGQATVLNNLGIVLGSLARREEAISHLQQALQLHGRIGDRDGEARALTNLGTIHTQLGDLARAADHHQQALALLRENRNRVGEMHALTGLGIVNQRLGRYQPALECHHLALSLAQQSGNLRGQAAAANGIGEALLATDDPAGSLAAHQSARQCADASGAPSELATAHAGLGRAHRELGDLDQCREHWLVAVALYDELGSSSEADRLRTELRAVDS